MIPCLVYQQLVEIVCQGWVTQEESEVQEVNCDLVDRLQCQLGKMNNRG